MALIVVGTIGVGYLLKKWKENIWLMNDLYISIYFYNELFVFSFWKTEISEWISKYFISKLIDKPID